MSLVERGNVSTRTNPFRIIYLRTSPEICFERIQTRSRESESSITLAYLQQIHRKYENWINGIENKSIVQCIDANQEVDFILKSIESFL